MNFDEFDDFEDNNEYDDFGDEGPFYDDNIDNEPDDISDNAGSGDSEKCRNRYRVE